MGSFPPNGLQLAAPSEKFTAALHVTRFTTVYLQGTGSFLPGPPVRNDELDRYIAPLNRQSERIKRRILADNGVQSRHYAIDPQGHAVQSTAAMAAHAIRDCLASADASIEEIGLLATGSSGGDLALPGLANMVQGELAAPPMETVTHHGVCAAGVMALKNAAQSIELGAHQRAIVATSEFPSRLFKRSRFAPRGHAADFDSHFLRWMLSDGAGAALLGNAPRTSGPTLRLDWVHARSFSGDFPVCMQLGRPEGATDGSYLDYDSVGAAESDGAFLLRQDIRLLPNLFDVAVHEYIRLVRAGHVDPGKVDHFLCHYSSERLGGVCHDLMSAANVAIPRERWYSNLARRGNTGAASIFIMLADFLRERTIKPGERVFCFVPESGRFTVSYLMFTVVEGGASRDATPVAPPHDPANVESGELSDLLAELADVWHDYRSRAWRTPLVKRTMAETLSQTDYLRWMSCWIPQVREGSGWMRQAAANLHEPFAPLKKIVDAHADDEQFDFKVLFEDYRLAGGDAADLDQLRRTPGGEALNSFMYATAARRNPIGLLGAIYIIEGTGNRIVPLLLPRLRKQLDLPERCFRFLQYHGENDVNHLERWLLAVRLALAADPSGVAARAIVSTARATSELYLLQLQQALDAP